MWILALGCASYQYERMAVQGEPTGAQEQLDDRMAELVLTDPNPNAPPPPPDPGPTREWFPEAFLWRPLVETGDDGTARVDFTVPDSLTTWRVLALAHDRAGHQSGAVATFDSALPLYAEPVVPGWLYTGDRLLLPVQVVNTTGAPLAARLDVRASGAMAGVGTAAFTLPAQGSAVRRLPLDVVGAGSARVTVALTAGAARDASERVVPILPSGRPVETVVTGGLGAERTLSLPPARGADPVTDRVEVRVFPNPLSVVHAEMERLAKGGNPNDPGYGYLVAAMDERLGGADAEARRVLRILSRQRVVTSTGGMGADPGWAASLLNTLRASAADPSASDLVSRVVTVLVSTQRADGTWAHEVRESPLDRVLLLTAAAGRALPASEAVARRRAAGALERHIGAIRDPFLAAVVVASGLLEPSLAEGLLPLVRSGVEPGAAPSPGEDLIGMPLSWTTRRAWAALALPPGDPQRLDLAASLVSEWSPTAGFGGFADAVALEAVVETLGAPTEPTELTLSTARGRASARLEGAEPVVLEVAAADAVTLATTPPAPGLVFVATRRSYVPWSAADRLSAGEVSVTLGPLQVGRPATLEIAVEAPPDAVLHAEVALPAGAVVDRSSLYQVLGSGGVQIVGGRVVVDCGPWRRTVKLDVTPAYAGRFQTAPIRVTIDGGPPIHVRPPVWNVAP